VTTVFKYCNTKTYLCTGYNANINYIAFVLLKKKRSIINDELEGMRKQWKYILRYYIFWHSHSENTSVRAFSAHEDAHNIKNLDVLPLG
jgi:hypothetical protein